MVIKQDVTRTAAKPSRSLLPRPTLRIKSSTASHCTPQYSTSSAIRTAVQYSWSQPRLGPISNHATKLPGISSVVTGSSPQCIFIFPSPLIPAIPLFASRTLPSPLTNCSNFCPPNVLFVIAIPVVTPGSTAISAPIRPNLPHTPQQNTIFVSHASICFLTCHTDLPLSSQVKFALNAHMVQCTHTQSQ